MMMLMLMLMKSNSNNSQQSNSNSKMSVRQRRKHMDVESETAIPDDGPRIYKSATSASAAAAAAADNNSNHHRQSTLLPRIDNVRLYANNPCRATFDLHNSDIGMANALRRNMLSRCHTLAIEWVEILNNGSVLPDTVYASRLGLVPLLSNHNIVNRLTRFDDCSCRGRRCPNCTIRMEICISNESIESSSSSNNNDDDVQATNTTTTTTTTTTSTTYHQPPEIAGGALAVTAKDLVVISAVQQENNDTGGTQPPLSLAAYPDMFLFHLARGQSIHIIATARLGVGREHDKWSPLCKSVCQWTRVITVGDTATANPQGATTYQTAHDIASTCPQRILHAAPLAAVTDHQQNGSSIRSNKKKSAAAVTSQQQQQLYTLDIEDASKCTACHQCTLKADELNYPLRVDLIPETFQFDIETTGVLQPMEVVRRSIHTIHDDLNQLQQTIVHQIQQHDALQMANPSSSTAAAAAPMLF
jgi:DNA-directed RNA polymerase II subunit RPB3